MASRRVEKSRHRKSFLDDVDPSHLATTHFPFATGAGGDSHKEAYRLVATGGVYAKGHSRRRLIIRRPVSSWSRPRDEPSGSDQGTAADFVGEQGHIRGARNLPLEELPTRVAELDDAPRRSIFVICRTDRRSVKAPRFLGRRGFGDVHVVQGGMTAWLDSGWPRTGRPPETD